MGTIVADHWCDCADAPLWAHGAVSLLGHPGGCEFPEGICTVREHRMTVHERCGRPLLVRYCGCGSTGFTLDVERNWWVCVWCGWPTRAWYRAAGAPAPEHLAGLRPITYHEFVPVPGSAKQVAKVLDERETELNRRFAGAWVRD